MSSMNSGDVSVPIHSHSTQDPALNLSEVIISGLIVWFSEGLQMNEKKPRKEELPNLNPDDVLRRMLNTPPQPRKKKTKEAKPEK